MHPLVASCKLSNRLTVPSLGGVAFMYHYTCMTTPQQCALRQRPLHHIRASVPPCPSQQHPITDALLPVLCLTPPQGRTKHYQTHYMCDSLVLVDCPGVVFPRLHVSPAMQVGVVGSVCVCALWARTVQQLLC